jgi:hypothetical protein
MQKLKDFFDPTWRKFLWFFGVVFVAELYLSVVSNVVPTLVNNFIVFVLNPGMPLLSGISAEQQILVPFAEVINLIWLYIIANIICTFKKEKKAEKNKQA